MSGMIFFQDLGKRDYMSKNRILKLIFMSFFSLLVFLNASFSIYGEETVINQPVNISGSGEYLDDNNVIYHLHFDKGENEQESIALPDFVKFEDTSTDQYQIAQGILTVNLVDVDSLDIDITGTVLNQEATDWVVSDNCIITIVPSTTEEEEEIPIFDEDTYINPNYPDINIERPFFLQSAPESAEEIEFTTVEEAGLYLREQMKARNVSITFRFETTSTDYRGLLRSIYEYAYAHTGVPNEGDYLFFQYGGYYCKIGGYVSKGVSHVIYTNTITYYTDAEKEQIVDGDVSAVLAQLELDGCSQYEKINRIHDYIITNVDYASDSSKSDYSRFTAYGALENGKAVCQGYSVLFYRLCLEAGIDARVISGTGNGIAHSWNIVLLDGLYYNVDTTWDHNSRILFFLKSDDEFPGHTRNDKYATDQFYQQYPMAASSYDPSEHYQIQLPESIELYPDETKAVEVTFIPEKPEQEISLTWSTDDPSICTITDGTLKGIAPGSTTIHVTAENGSEASCVVTVKEFEPFTITNPAADVVYDGEQHRWVPNITDAQGNVLVEGEHYTVEYNTEDFINTGKIEVTIKGLSIYKGEYNYSYSILPAPLTIITESASKKYDGTELMCPKGRVEGLVNGETLTLVVNGTITDVGSTVNGYVIKWNGSALEHNYQIEENLGILTIEKGSKTPSTGIETNQGRWIFTGMISIISVMVFVCKKIKNQ